MVRRSVAGLILAGLVLGAPAEPVSATEWLTYGFNLERTGENPFETVLTPETADGLHLLWSFPLGAVTIMQPVLAENVLVRGQPMNLVFIGTEHGDFYAIDADTGTPVWHRNLGSQETDCGDMPDGIFGVSGSPAIDRPNNQLYVVGGDGNMYCLDLSTGRKAAGWPVTITTDPAHHHCYGAVTLTSHYAYATLASYCDISPYYGGVVAVDLQQLTPRQFYPAGRQIEGGGVWGPGGVSADSSTGHVFTATGNALYDPESVGYCENVVELSTKLRVLGSDYPGLTGGDVDFGATPILYQPPGCPPMVAAKNKTGVLVTYERGQVSDGAAQRLQIANVSDWQFNGIPAWSETTHMLYIGNSSDSNRDVYKHGMVALSVDENCQLQLAWQTTIGPNFASVSPPTVAGGVVYYGDGIGNQLLAFDALSGTLLWSSEDTIQGPIFAAPMVVNGRVYVGAWDGQFYAFGL